MSLRRPSPTPGSTPEVNSIVMATGTPTPVVTLAAGAPGITVLTFTVGLTDAEKAAYLCIEKVAGAVVPTAEKILAEGTAIAQAGEITADNLKEGHGLYHRRRSIQQRGLFRSQVD